MVSAQLCLPQQKSGGAHRLRGNASCTFPDWSWDGTHWLRAAGSQPESEGMAGLGSRPAAPRSRRAGQRQRPAGLLGSESWNGTHALRTAVFLWLMVRRALYTSLQLAARALLGHGKEQLCDAGGDGRLSCGAQPFAAEARSKEQRRLMKPGRRLWYCTRFGIIRTYNLLQCDWFLLFAWFLSKAGFGFVSLTRIFSTAWCVSSI